MGNISFLKAEIKKMERNTHHNRHGENLLLLAKKINSPVKKKLQEINKKHEQVGYLDHDLWNKRYKISQKLFKELKKKSPSYYDEVHGAF